jgi:hypothetical protein
MEQVRGMPQPPVHRGGVADKPYRKPSQRGEALLDEHVEAGCDPLRAVSGNAHNGGRYHIYFRLTKICV